MPSKKYAVKLTLDEAKKLGIVFCECEHAWNNHFQHGDAECAFCDCKKLIIRFIVGKKM